MYKYEQYVISLNLRKRNGVFNLKGHNTQHSGHMGQNLSN